MSRSSLKLLTPVQMGDLRPRNRVVMAPLTRSRALEGNVPNPLAATYYAQRASAGLIVSEGTQVSQQGVGYPNTPGMHSDAQVEGWKRITGAVHERGGLIVAQLWHVGRVSLPMLQPDGGLPVGPSAIAPAGKAYTAQGPVPYGVPRALETSEIRGIVEDFVQAAKRAKAAGFDGVELHGANGYLIDQFLRDGSNQRNDQYGGSIANRSRLLVELLEAVTPVWGGGRVGVRLSLAHGDGGSLRDSDPKALLAHVASELNRFSPAYLHLIDAIGGQRYSPDAPKLGPVARERFEGALILNGGYTGETAEAAVQEGRADAIAFGTLYISNPDLVERIAQGAPMDPLDPATLYGGGEKGYTDYPALGTKAA